MIKWKTTVNEKKVDGDPLMSLNLHTRKKMLKIIGQFPSSTHGYSQSVWKKRKKGREK